MKLWYSSLHIIDEPPLWYPIGEVSINVRFSFRLMNRESLEKIQKSQRSQSWVIDKCQVVPHAVWFSPSSAAYEHYIISVVPLLVAKTVQPIAPKVYKTLFFYLRTHRWLSESAAVCISTSNDSIASRAGWVRDLLLLTPIVFLGSACLTLPAFKSSSVRNNRIAVSELCKSDLLV